MPAPESSAHPLRAKRVLVTGGTGFLGSHLVKALVGLGAHVAVFLRPSSGRDRIKDCVPHVALVQGNFHDRADVRRAVAQVRPQIVMHLAAVGVNPKESETAAIVQTNVLGLTHLLDALADSPLERFINTGSCFEYGNQTTPLTEQHPLDPLNAYAASKIAAWHLCHLRHRQEGLPVVTLRPFTFFGPDEPPWRLIPSTILAILQERDIRITSGTQTRDYTYVEDMVAAYLRAAVTPGIVGETFNIGSGQDAAVQDIVARIRDLMHSRVPIHLGAVEGRKAEAWRLCCDASKAHALLGWQPKVSFEDGLRRTIAQLSVTAGAGAA